MTVLLLVGCGLGSPEDIAPTTNELVRAHWVPLGDDLGPGPSFLMSAPSLAADPLARPLLAFSSYDPATFADSTTVSGWNGSTWTPLGQAFVGAGPSIGVDSRERPFVCYGSGPFVKRWTGTRWLDLGGDVSTATGYRGVRYGVWGCEGLVFDSRRDPVVAWSADVGAKANYIYAARWSTSHHRWLGIGGPIGPRATSAAIDIDEDDRIYLATFTPGGSYGGHDTTRVFRANGQEWTQLGPEVPDTVDPTIAVYDNRAYLAYGVLRDGEPPLLEVARWVGGSWRSLGTGFSGTSPRIDFTPSGKVVMAYVRAEPLPGGVERRTLRVVRLSNAQTWLPVGEDVADVTGALARLDLALDSKGRPTVAWSQQGEGGGDGALFVRRLDTPLP